MLHRNRKSIQAICLALSKRLFCRGHKHTWSDEHFYILDEGEITFLVGDEIKVGKKSDFIFVPRNTRHAFRVEREAVFLNGYTPAGLELAIIEMAMPAPTRTIPPKGATSPPNMSSEQYRRYGMDNLPGLNPQAPT